MKKIAMVSTALVLSCFLSACSTQTYDDGYEAGYNAGFDSGYQEGHIEGYKRGQLAAGSSSDNDAPSFEEWWEEQNKNEPTGTNPSTVAEPISGTILSGKEYDESQITITADGDSSYVVSLKTSSGAERLSFYVRAGETVTIGVPAEHLYVYFASGTSWYGYGKGLMFGEDTAYSKDDDMLNFAEYTWEYTLYPVYDGNFSETPSDETEFFG